MSKMGNYYHELEELNNWKEGDNPSPVPCKKCKGKGLRWKRQRSMGRSGSSRAIALFETASKVSYNSVR